jgi:hypothetical protein
MRGFLLFALAVGAVATLYGTPHVRTEGHCATYDKGRTCAYVISCTYVGIQGYRKVWPAWTPDVSACSPVHWFRMQSPLLHWTPEPPLTKGETFSALSF